MKPILLACVILAGYLFGPTAAAQVNDAFADLSAEIETLRSMAQTERKNLVADNLVLTETESQAFWPVYNQYRADMRAVDDKKVKLITDYAAKYQTLTDADAKKLIADHLKYQSDVVKLRNQYVAKFAKVMPMTKVARFYQIENRLDALSNLVIANNIPLTR